MRSLVSLLLSPVLRYWARKASPQRRGTISLAGLRDKAKVLWAPFAIPHIFASSEHDLFMAQGYLHAQERLWQMDIGRRFLSGRLAEVLGDQPIPWRELSIRFNDKTAVDLDYFVRLMGIRRVACASLKLLPEEFVDPLRAYSDGVNRYIETHLRALPVEFRILRYEPEPWRPEDSLTIGKGFALFLSTSLFTRLTMTGIAEKLKDYEPKLRSLLPNSPDGPTITRSAAESCRQLRTFLNGTFHQSAWGGAGWGSNNWVIAPSHSATGRVILCNDPHLRMTLPSVWYLMHLRASPDGTDDGIEAWGASIPGSPCIHLGHNRWIAWGVTAALCDDADLYVEKIHPKEPDQYLAGSEWLKMERQEETISVRGGREVRRAVRFTRHGPLISDLLHKTESREALALKWTAHVPSQEFRALYGVNRARHWEEFLHSLSHQVAPTLNYVYGDTHGNIGYSLAGRVPVRPETHSLLPLPGWSGEFEWKGDIPFSELPRLYNPPEGIIASANNRIADDSYPYYLSDLFEPGYRMERIKELLTAAAQLSLDDMAAVQGDTVSIHARTLLRELQGDLEQAAAGKDDALRRAVTWLIRWDGNCGENSPEAALFHRFHQRLMANLLEEDLGDELFICYTEIFNQAIAPTDRILRDPRSPWFSLRSRSALVEKSLVEAQEELTRLFGEDMKKWNWGEIHTATLNHPMGRSKILAPFFSLGPFPAPGDGFTINMGFYNHSNPFRHVVGASLRMITDVGHWENSRFILPSGQSGHPFSPYYRDQLSLWRTLQYLPLARKENDTGNFPALELVP